VSAYWIVRYSFGLFITVVPEKEEVTLMLTIQDYRVVIFKFALY